MQPDRKVTVGTVAGALTGLTVWLAGELYAVQIPPDVAVYISTLIMAVLMYIMPNSTRTESTTQE